MKVSIGMLAHNEENTIGSAIQQILNQDIFDVSNLDIQFLVITNGCTDRTAFVATEVIDKSDINQDLRVVNITMAGKSNAWNVYAHNAAWQDADYLVLVDADIDLYDTTSLTKLVYRLIDTPGASVSTDIPRKDIEKKKDKNIFDKLSILLSKINNQKKRAITGQLYCIKGDKARQIYLPVGLPVEDGFLAAMIQTENFTQNNSKTNRITVVESVSHYFQAFVNPIDLLKHEKRLMIGSAINSMIFNYLWANVSGKSMHAGIMVRDLNHSQPKWLEALIVQYKGKRGFWFVPKDLCLKHFRNLRKSTEPLLMKLVKLPIVLAVTFGLICLAINVNFYFRTENGIGYW